MNRRILVVHSRYAQAAGEDTAVDQHVSALRRSGDAVHLTEQSTSHRRRNRLYPIAAAATVASGVGPTPLAAIRSFQPDVVHVHNLFPNFGRRWLRGVKTPLVATLHNFRPLCPAATFYRDGHICTDCLDGGNARPSVQHGCYRQSRLRTVPLAISTNFAADPLLRTASALIVLNDAMRDLYARAGVADARLHVMPNFLPDQDVREPGPGGRFWLYVGRLSPEKGILRLVEEWPEDRDLIIAGDGPDLERVRAAAASRPGVRALGEQQPSSVQALMDAALGLVFPSRWIEGSPLTYIESIAAGTPVLAWEPSSVAHTIRKEGTGMVAKGALKDVLHAAADSFPQQREHCRRVFETTYSERAWIARLSDLYAEILERSRSV